jgi:hypothetical protein
LTDKLKHLPPDFRVWAEEAMLKSLGFDMSSKKENGQSNGNNQEAAGDGIGMWVEH